MSRSSGSNNRPISGSNATRSNNVSSLSGSNIAASGHVGRERAAASSSSSSAVNRSVATEKFASLMSMLNDAEDGEETIELRSPPHAHAATVPRGNGAPQTPSRQNRPLSAAALLTSPRSQQHAPYVPITRSTAVQPPPSPSLSNSYSSDTFSPLSSPRSVRNGAGGGGGSNVFAASPSPRHASTAGAVQLPLPIPSASPVLKKSDSNTSTTSTTGTASGTSTATTATGHSYFPLDSLKAKLVSLKSELASKDTVIGQLQAKLSQTEVSSVSKVTQVQQELQQQKQEYETLLKSNQEFLEKVLRDKKELNDKCETLNEKYLKLSQDFDSKQQHFRRELLTAELSKAKESWLAAEKITREKYLQEKVKLIKSETLRTVEKDVQSVLEKQKIQSQDYAALLEKQHKQNLLDQKVDHENLIASIRKQHAIEIEQMREQEKLEKQKKVRETIEKYDKLLQDQRMKYLSELEQSRSQATTSSSVLKEAIDTALLQQRKEHLYELNKLKEQHQHSLDDLTRRYTLKEQSEKERLAIEKDTWSSLVQAKFVKEFNEKERALKSKLQSEQAEELNLIIEKLTHENELSVKELIKEYERKMDAIKKQSQTDIHTSKRTIDDLAQKLNDLQRRYIQLETKFTDTSTQLSSTQSHLTEKNHSLTKQQDTIHSLEKRLSTATKDVETKFYTEKHELRSQFQSQQSKIDELQTKLSNQAKEYETKLQASLQAREQDHAQQLESMQVRVKDIMAKKEAIISSLKQQVAASQQELANQQKELMDQINA